MSLFSHFHRRRHLVARDLAVALVVLVTVLTPAGALAQGPGNLDWRYYGNDLANTRYQNVDQINPTNVAGLKVAWVFHLGGLPDSEYTLEGSPIVINGTMYVTNGHDDVFALDAATGAQKWAYHPLSDMPPLDQISLCCGHDNRGVAYGNGKIFLGRLDANLVALDATTGQVAWKSQVADWHQGFSITMAPQFVNGKVIIGVSGGEYEVNGRVSAFDANTGHQVWSFNTTKPSGADVPTWTGNSWKTGGAPVWQTPSVDPALNLIYITTGNAAPDLNGIQRAGQNLYTASIVALDINTGNYVWHFQEVHHDIWDYDGPQPSVLFDFNGTPAIGHCNKNVNYYILDRRTGTPLIPVTEQPVPTTPAWQHPWPTQPFSAVQMLVPNYVESTPAGYVSAPEYTPPSQTPTIEQPGASGGCEWPPAAYSPRTKMVYYGGRYQPNLYSTSPNNTSGFASTAEPAIPGVKDYGVFGGTNTTTGKIAWKNRVAQPALSGLAVAGDLVFYGESNQKFHAVNAATGANLWTFDASTVPGAGGANAAPAVYVVNGKEYVVNLFGGNTEDREVTGSPQGDTVIAFALP